MQLVLVIDDEADVRLLCRMNLRHAGYEVLEADGGEHGVALANERTPDAVILDLMMPRFDGHEVLRRLRATPASAEVPVLVLTADGRIDSHRACYALGADAVVTKPFMPESLTDGVARLISMSLEERVSARRSAEEAARTMFG